MIRDDRAAVELVYTVFVIGLLVGISYFFTGCASMGGANSSMGECRLLCQGQKVDSYRDETSECRCRIGNKEVLQ